MFRILFLRNKDPYFDYSKCSKDLDACEKRIKYLRDQALHKNPAVRNQVNSEDLVKVEKRFKAIQKEMGAFNITEPFQEQINKIKKLFASAKIIPKYKDVKVEEEELNKFGYLKTDEMEKNLSSCFGLLDKATRKIQDRKWYIRWLNPPEKDLKEAKEIQDKLTKRIESLPKPVAKRDEARYEQLAELCEALPGAKTKTDLFAQIQTSQWGAARKLCETLRLNHKSDDSRFKIAQMRAALPEATPDGQELTIPCELVPKTITTSFEKVQGAFQAFQTAVKEAIANRKAQIEAYNIMPPDQKKIPNIEKEITVLEGLLNS